jgi:hypothetical protein
MLVAENPSEWSHAPGRRQPSPPCRGERVSPLCVAIALVVAQGQAGLTQIAAWSQPSCPRPGWQRETDGVSAGPVVYCEPAWTCKAS